MASVKVKLRLSTVNNKDGFLYYQVIHKRTVRQIGTDYKVAKDEWDSHSESIVPPAGDAVRTRQLQHISKMVMHERNMLSCIISSLNGLAGGYTADDIVEHFNRRPHELSLSAFTRDTALLLRRAGRDRTAETYEATLNSLIRFNDGYDILLPEIDAGMVMDYEAHLKSRGVTMNTISFYMRILRAIYNRAVDIGIIEQGHPFKKVYTGIGKTHKRAMSLKAVRQLKEVDLSHDARLDFARDMFMFSFYTRGMSFIDMAYLRTRDLSNGVLTYRRRKTGQMLCIKWERCMNEIVEKYNKGKMRPYILPIIRNTQKDRRNQYKNGLAMVNRYLKEVARCAGLHTTLTMYVARHSWASIARSRNVPLSVISEGMGHDSEATTQIYLASLDTSTVDRANSMILKLI